MQQRAPRSMAKRLRSFDIFPKSVEDVREQASAGAAVTIVGVLVMLFLFVSEFSSYTQVVTEDTIFVDTTREKTMWINFELVFLQLACKEVEVDIVDNFGDPQRGRRDIQKQAVDPEQYLQQTFSSWFTSAHTEEFPKGSGCRVFGKAEVQKVKGNLHIAAGSNAPQSHDGHQHHVHHITPEQVASFNVSHFIPHLSFGPAFPRRTDPLSWTRVIEPNAMQVNHMIQLVPTIYEDWGGNVIEGYQYSAQTNYKHIVPGASSFPLPGVFIKWDMSPFVIQYRETGRSFAHFLTRLCAITGGTFVVLGLIYSGLTKAFPALRTVREKTTGVPGPLSHNKHHHHHHGL